MKERSFDNNSIDYTRGFIVILCYALLFSGIGITIWQGIEEYNWYDRYSLATERSIKCLYTAENTFNHTLMGDRVQKALNEIDHLNGNYDIWYATVETDYTSIKESLTSCIDYCYHSNGTALEQNALIQLIENIIFDMEIARDCWEQTQNAIDHGCLIVLGVVIFLIGCYGTYKVTHDY